MLSLYIHCKLGQAAAWSQLFAAMGQVYPTVELPGHGCAPEWDVAQDYLTQACDLATAKLMAPTHIVGHSFGGATALRLAAERPDLVRSLTLIEPVFFKAAFMADPDLKQVYSRQVAPFHAAMQAGDPTTAAMLFSEHWNDVPWDMIRTQQQDYMVDRMPLIVAAEASIVDDNSDIWSKLESIDMPVLLLEGEVSPAPIADIQKSLATNLPRATRQVISKAGHMGPISHPKPFAEAILAFQQGH